MAPELAEHRLHFVRQSRRGQTGADQNRAGVVEQFHVRLPGVDHGGLQLRRDGVINGLVREQRDESGPGALRGARGQHRGPVKSQAAGDDRQMAERTFVVRNGAGRRNIFKILRLRPVQHAPMRAGNQSDAVQHLKPAHERPRGLREQSRFRRADGERDRRFDGRAKCFAGVGVQAGWHVHGERGNFRPVDRGDEFFPAVVERAVQADAEQAVNDQRRVQSERQFKARQIHLGRGDVERFDAASVEVSGGGAGVVAVVAHAGEDEDQVVGTREFAGTAGDLFADAPDDIVFGPAGSPRCVFPIAHLRDADDWNWHGGSVAEYFDGAKGECRARPSTPPPRLAAKPNGGLDVSRDEGVVSTFCDEASQPRVAGKFQEILRRFMPGDPQN